MSLTNPTSTTLSIASRRFAIFARVLSRIQRKILSTTRRCHGALVRIFICSFPTLKSRCQLKSQERGGMGIGETNT